MIVALGWVVMIVVLGWVVIIVVLGWVVIIVVLGWVVIIVVLGWVVMIVVLGWVVIIVVLGWVFIIISVVGDSTFSIHWFVNVSGSNPSGHSFKHSWEYSILEILLLQTREVISHIQILFINSSSRCKLFLQYSLIISLLEDKIILSSGHWVL